MLWVSGIVSVEPILEAQWHSMVLLQRAHIEDGLKAFNPRIVDACADILLRESKWIYYTWKQFEHLGGRNLFR